MKLPLRWGVPILLALLLSSGYVGIVERTILLVLAMGVALRMAFSLPIPPRRADADPDGDGPGAGESAEPEEPRRDDAAKRRDPLPPAAS
ncbi:MAG: hypothetical protein HY423_11505 [Candidatus Lambdaproteobacteria bacterium]|nr:hypothetical protein [Candidatus Lambdaproteobacteria bacterium]